MKNLIIVAILVLFTSIAYGQRVDIFYNYHYGTEDYRTGSEIGANIIFGERDATGYHLALGVSAFAINKEEWDYYYSDKTLNATGVTVGWFPRNENNFFYSVTGYFGEKNTVGGQIGYRWNWAGISTGYSGIGGWGVGLHLIF